MLLFISLPVFPPFGVAVTHGNPISSCSPIVPLYVPKLYGVPSEFTYTISLSTEQPGHIDVYCWIRCIPNQNEFNIRLKSGFGSRIGQTEALVWHWSSRSLNVRNTKSYSSLLWIVATSAQLSRHILWAFNWNIFEKFNIM